MNRCVLRQHVLALSALLGLFILCPAVRAQTDTGTERQPAGNVDEYGPKGVGEPTVITAAVSNITSTDATCGGNVTDEGATWVEGRGVCWNTATGPTTANDNTSNGGGLGPFTSNLTGLTAGTTYYVRAYVRKAFHAGTSYGAEISFTTHTTPTLAATTPASSITSTDAASGGNVTADCGATVTARGICWNTATAPTTANNKTIAAGTTGPFTSNLTGLTAGTTYYVRAYATNSVGTSYGAEISFTTHTTPTLAATTPVSSITATDAASGGNVTADGGATITARGICWNTATAPTTTNNKTIAAGTTGPFTGNLTGLTAGTIHYVRAYATNSVGTSYGAEISFTTDTTPTLAATTPASSITATDAASGGNVTADGGATITARGICWNTATAPTTANNKTIAAGTTGPFTSNLTGLTTGTIYYVRSYATNSVGTGYGAEISFTTDTTPTLAATTPVSDITTTDAASGGDVTADGGATVTARGICWNTTTEPTTANDKTTEAGTTGAFTSNLTGLIAGATYYVRAYATNSVGTSYGIEIIFTTAGGDGEWGPPDSDDDGTPDSSDGCPNDANKTSPGSCGCGASDTDTDDDGTLDCNDSCPNDPNKTSPGSLGCGLDDDTDTDDDGTPDAVDDCPDDPSKTEPGLAGCGVAETDSDGDGTPDSVDGCPDNPNKIEPGIEGCDVFESDADGDGTPDSVDSCPNDPNKTEPGLAGCGVAEADSDGDGTPDSVDGCPDNPNKVEPGIKGCDALESDADGDGTPDSVDSCPNDPNKIAPGLAGCDVEETDSDGDGTPDSVDKCPDDPNKTTLGDGGCKTIEPDTDGDGVPDSVDVCLNDPNKVTPGMFGCNVTESDVDGDATPDELDGCPDDPNKIAPGSAGCGVTEPDVDGDGTPDSHDDCPDDPHKSDPGNLGCGVRESPNLQVAIEIDNDDDGGEDNTPGTVSVGSEINAWVTVSNTGNGSATNVRVEVPIPSNTQFVSAAFEQIRTGAIVPVEFIVEDDTVHLYLGEVAASNLIEVYLTLRAIETGNVVIAPKTGSNEMADTEGVDTPGEAMVADDKYVRIVTTSQTPCGVLGMIPMAMLLCTMLGLKCRSR